MSATDIVPRAFFALKTDVRQNVHYITDFQILFAAGSVLILQNYYEKRQRLINLHEKCVFLEFIAISPSRKLIAIILNGERGQIIIFDVETLKKRKTLNLPPDSTTNRFEFISFTHDEVYIAALTGEPEWNLLLYKWERGKLTSFCKIINTNNSATVVQICCSPTDSSDICVVGRGLFRLLYRTKTIWKQYGFQKADLLNITSAAWLSDHTILCGTIDGRLFVVDNGELKNTYNAFTVTTVWCTGKDDSSVKDSSSLLLVRRLTKEEEFEDMAVRTIISFSKGFAYSCKSGYVHLFEKETPYKYKRRNVFCIVDSDLKHLPQLELNIVKHISINISQDRLLVTTNRSQLYTIRLWGQDITNAPEIPFKHLGESLHHGPVGGLTMCMWKPLFATFGKMDRTIRIWNYDTEAINIIKYYSEEILAIDFHPTGNFIAIAFHEKVDISFVLLSDLQTLRVLPKKECHIVRYSCYGQYLAATSEDEIHIFGTILFNNIFSLKGHLGKINAMQWILDDKRLASCCSQGQIIIWELVKGDIIGEIKMPEVSFCDFAVSSDGTTIFAVDSNGFLNKFSNLNLSMSLKFQHYNLEKIVLSRSNFMMLMTGNGSGIISAKLPLTNPPEFAEFHFHMSTIQQLKFSYDDQILVSISIAGAVILWKVTAGEGKLLPIDKNFAYATEVLINKTELEQKILEIKNLSEKLHELEMKQLRELRVTERAYCDKMKEMHDNFMHKVRNQRSKIEEVETNQAKQLMDLKIEVDELIEKQSKEKQDLIENYKNKLSVEYEKVRSSEALYNETVNDFENRLAELEKSKKEETDAVIRSYDEKLDQAENLLQQAYRRNADSIVKQNKEKGYIEEDTDREIIEIVAKYEGLLKEEREQNITLKEETAILNKKFAEASKENDLVRQNFEKLQKDLEKYRTNIHELEKYLKDLKVEITERDAALEEKNESIFLLKKQIQESEKFKFVLEYKIEVLRKEIDPKERIIREKKEQIVDMEVEKDSLKKLNCSLELQLIELKEKIHGTEKDVDVCENKYNSRVVALKEIKLDLHHLYQNLKDFQKLRNGIKVLSNKYHECNIDERKKFGESDVQTALLVQRMFLERTIKALKSTLQKSTKSKTNKAKVVQDNVVLLEELNFVRRELSTASVKIKKLENLTTGKYNKLTAPSEAFKKLEKALENQEAIRRTYQTVTDEANAETKELNTKVDVMHNKLLRLLQTDDQ